jgi:hypothetical protein
MRWVPTDVNGGYDSELESATGTTCAACGLVVSTGKILEVGEAGRVAAQSAEAKASRTETQRRNAIAQHAWENSNGIIDETYALEIQPRLGKLSISTIAAALSVSWSYAADIRTGRRRPHARHWLVLAQIAGLANLEKRQKPEGDR